MRAVKMIRVILMNMNPPMLTTLIKAWDLANEHMFGVFRLTTGAAQSVLLQFEPKYGRPGDGKQAWLGLQSKYQNNSPQRRRALLRRLDNSVMKPDTDPDVFLSEINQIRTRCFGRNSLNGALACSNT